jgi:hypothetical protein
MIILHSFSCRITPSYLVAHIDISFNFRTDGRRITLKMFLDDTIYNKGAATCSKGDHFKTVDVKIRIRV